MKKLIVAINGLMLLAGMLVMSSFLTNPANAASPNLQNGTMMSEHAKPKRHRRHAGHHKYTPPKYQRYHKHPKHHPKPHHKNG